LIKEETLGVEANLKSGWTIEKLQEYFDYSLSSTRDVFIDDYFSKNVYEQIESYCQKMGSLEFSRELTNTKICLDEISSTIKTNLGASYDYGGLIDFFPKCLSPLDTCLNLGFQKGTDNLKNCVLELS
jgi:hypothetical protein